MWSCAVIVATVWWKNLASLITTLVSPVEVDGVRKESIDEPTTERRRRGLVL